MKTDQNAGDLGKYNVGHERHKDDNEFLESQWKKKSKENEYERTQTKWEKKKDHLPVDFD